MIAIIGSGGIAELHIRALGQIGRRPELIYNKTKRGLGERYGIREVDTLEALISSGCESFHICTPPETHEEFIRTLLSNPSLRVRYIFCEKPLAHSAESARRIQTLLESARRQGRKIRFATGFNTRFYPAVKEMRRRVGQGDIGTPRLVCTSYFQEFHVMPQPMSWRYRDRMRALTEIGSHLLDLVRFVTREEIELTEATLSRPDRHRIVGKDGLMRPLSADSGISGISDTSVVAVDSEDAALLRGRLTQSSAWIDLVVSETAHGYKNKESIEVIGTLGSLKWDSQNPMELIWSRHEQPDSIWRYAFDSGFSDTFATQFHHFYDQSTEEAAERPLFATLEDGVVNSSLCEDAYQLDPGTRAERIASHYGMKLIPEEQVFVHVVARSEETDAEGRSLYNSMLGMHSNQHGSYSRFHRLDVDETWHFYEGDPFRIVLLVPGESEQIFLLGPRFDLGQMRSVVIPKDTWFASELITDRPDAYALFGCSLAPAFEARGFEGGYVETLLNEFPQSEEWIRRLAVDGDRRATHTIV